jgi:beta-aspartyl-peptidase (threonine type)
VLRVGPSATALALARGLDVVVPGTMITEAAARRLAARRAAGGETVGAVARDAAGRVAAATSTGGLVGKRRGRIGDSAVIGARTYADDRLGAVSCTGPGEAIIRLVLGRRALEHVAGGATPQAAAEAGLDELRARIGETAGLIVVAPDGRLGVAYTTEAMATAWRGRAPG